ncbi:serine/arginine-rich splicing factor 4-like [Lytechinus variegatus]|uniref:serine/arginine-rich splicing factor 4-like n=1 Tax=Lytechinus variegatus TaxID=7654 RepID=UPI001BB0DE4B|nr:serine/arginine-rich splicing factor 4-like [Lytechinus variegatus]
MPNTRKQFDLNTCTVDDLESVDGLTRPLAKRIISYRNREGRFNTISELGKVKGIGDRTLSLISGRVFILPSSPRSRRSSLASSRANSPRRRTRASVSRVSFSRSPSPIRRKSHKREGSPTRRSERILSRSSLSRRSSQSSYPGRSSLPRRASPKRKGSSSKQTPRTKKLSKSGSRSGPVFVDGDKNVSIDLGKLARDGCNLTLHSGGRNGQSSPIITINVKELDGPTPSVGLSIPNPSKAITDQRSSSPERPTRASSVVGENLREYHVIRETKRVIENFSEEQGPIVELPEEKKSLKQSQNRGPHKIEHRHRDSGGGHHRDRKRSRSRSWTQSLSRSRSSSPKKRIVRRSRSRSGSPHHSPPRPGKRQASPINERLSRSEIENWLKDGSAPPLHVDRGMTGPQATSTPGRRRDRRRSPGQDIASTSRRNNDDHESRSPRRKLELEDDDVRGHRRRNVDSKDHAVETMDRSRSRSRGRRSTERPDEDEGGSGEMVRRHRSREPRRHSKTDGKSHRHRRRDETSPYAQASWCSIA